MDKENLVQNEKILWRLKVKKEENLWSGILIICNMMQYTKYVKMWNIFIFSLLLYLAIRSCFNATIA
jgi:hypothetical protein